MDQNDPSIYREPATQHLLNLHQQQPIPQPYPSSYSYSYYPNPNPNPNPEPPHLYPPAPAPAPNLLYYAAGSEPIPQYAVNSFSYGVMKKVGTRKMVVDLETKKRKVIEGGTPADSVRTCSLCNVVCNSDMVFASHLAGEKHALKSQGISSNGKKLNAHVHLKAMYRANKAAQPTPTPAVKKVSKGPIALVQSPHCEVCKIDCNSQESFNRHKVGKKHMKNLQKLQDSIGPKPASAASACPTVGQKDTPIAAKPEAVSEKPAEDLETGKQKLLKEGDAADEAVSEKPAEDLETKKQKLLKEGAAADAVRACTICSIVCNSETVFNFHIRGHKHLAMVKKQHASPVPVS